MIYDRVIHRDLFNEAKLLKCLGQVALLLHEGKGSLPVQFEHDKDIVEGFVIEQDPDSGDLYCANLRLMTDDDEEIGLYSSYNSKENYPLVFVTRDEEEFRALDENGQFTPEFLDEVRRWAEEGPRD